MAENSVACLADRRVAPMVVLMAAQMAAPRAVQMVACLVEKTAENSAG